MPVSVEYLLQPIDPTTFISRHYAREPLLINRGDPSYYQGLLAVDALDRITQLT
ncbi:MAG: hypothetical protein WB646_20555 [Steroidobacteraceae bacterium]